VGERDRRDLHRHPGRGRHLARGGGAGRRGAGVPRRRGITGQEAFLLAAGEGTNSRIYHTDDGGRTWQLQFKNRDPSGFYDCFAFWTPDRALVMADAINGRFPVRRTQDGHHWGDIGDKLPTALAGEAAFAASGTCVATQGEANAWITTGASERARVLRTTNRGKSWKVSALPIAHNSGGAGGFSVAFRDALHGVVGGGDFEATREVGNFAISHDGGATWFPRNKAPIKGAIFGLSYVAKHDQGPNVRRIVATGPDGVAYTNDEGMTWTRITGEANFWAVTFANTHVGWLVGTEGSISKITF
jgi:photosystem II stability/assembly factor-like uncharacterized protein